ncbi:hypothetical protein DOTSEDRAFT_72405 [Dothistroma septosporum NZE10]|uniref:cyclin-dependent kinase n=1 Tax=Dothistroma septosporum (strain NZE10 / CBS 128990) TaxID=675120 RepID=M2YM51_DOTSN|nr:hypothetical protein DOTSEDRAFT_72405 [Dothistroma septosporum NZE10]
MDGSSLDKPEQSWAEENSRHDHSSRHRSRDFREGRDSSEAAAVRENPKPSGVAVAAARPPHSASRATSRSPSPDRYHHHHHHRRHRAKSATRRSSRSPVSPRDLPGEGDFRQAQDRASRQHQPSHRHAESATPHKGRTSRSPSPSTSHHRYHKRHRSRTLERHSSPSRNHKSSTKAASCARSPRPAQDKDALAETRQAADQRTPRRRRSWSEESRRETDSRRNRQPASPERYWRGESPDRNRRRSRDRRYSRSSPAEQRIDRAYGDTSRHRDEAHPRGSRRSPRRARGGDRGSRRATRSPIDSAARATSRESLRKDQSSHRRRDQSRERSVSPDSRRSRKEASGRDAEMYGRGNYGGYPHGQSPYQHNAYQQPGHSHNGSPYQQGYQQPPAQPGAPYHQPRSGNQYGGSPNYPARESFSRPPQRGGAATRGGRAHFANLSWTPGDGVKGGHLVQPGDKPKEGTSSTTTPQLKSVIAPPDPEDEDNPFRPPAGLRAEDESANKRRKIDATLDTGAMSKTAEELAAQAEREKNKISFSIKGRASIAAVDKAPVVSKSSKADTSPLLAKKLPSTISPLVQSTVQSNMPKSSNYVGNTRVGPPRQPSPPRTQKKMVRKKRIKTRPQLSEEHAKSDSVYYRKTGNDSVVGSGTYGKVYKAVHVYTGGMVALKKIRMEGERDGFPVTAIREIKLLQSLNHVNVVPLLEVMVERNDCFMVFEYMSHDLTGLLNHPTFALSAAHKKDLAKQMFEGLDYLHKRGVLHRDIKAANILVSNSGVLKFADFGLARFYQKRQKQDYTNRVITIWYRSPELLLGETQYGPAVDIWSAACVLVEIFTRHAIFPGDGSEINQLDKIYNVLGTPSRSEWPGVSELQWYELLRPTHRSNSTFKEKYQDKVSPEAFELLQAMLLYDPANRPTASDVLEHPYFKGEEPKPAQVVELADLEGDWHEFESKALRKEKERQERETRRREREGEKRKAEEAAGGEVKKPRTMETATAAAG